MIQVVEPEGILRDPELGKAQIIEREMAQELGVKIFQVQRHWYDHFDHPLWKRIRTEAETAGGHGGMDFVMLWRMVQCLREGIALDQNVYDGAAWSSLFPLTHASVVSRSEPVSVPDFTRGRWQQPSA